MSKHKDLAIFLLRQALAASFFSAVASRLDLWGGQSSGWKEFLIYAGQVNSYAPKSLVPVLAITSTVLETLISILLVIGYKTRLAAFAATSLTLIFALAMAYSFGIKSPLDYSVFVDSTAALLLSGMPSYKWSLDEKLTLHKDKKH